MSTNRLRYNVGVIKKADGTIKQIFIGLADSTPFLAMKETATVSNSSVTVVKYLPVDYLRTLMALSQAAIDTRVNLNDYDNTAAPLYTTAATAGFSGLREISISNNTDTLTESYNGAPYFSLHGEGVQEYEEVANTYVPASLVGDISGTGSTQTAAPSVTGISFIDEILNFISNNLILVAVAAAAFFYFDPFGWFGKKGKKKRG